MSQASIFHSGELELQERAEVREAVGAFASRAIRPFMPEQHREFFQTLPFMVAGVVDGQGRPWATLLSGRPGFVQSPDSTSLHLAVATPQAPELAEGLADGASIGLLGIELGTRRRNRANGVIAHSGNDGLQVEVRESFGNCPKYIQTRAISWRDEAPSTQLEKLTTLTDEARRLIANADTFFVASYVDDENSRRVDVSHRGGLPGFAGLNAQGQLRVPDFTGNFMFCTLGNFLRQPQAGLVFVDFASGDLLHLSGRVELVWEGGVVADYPGAVHAWLFDWESAFWLRAALPFSAGSGNYSPFLQGLGPWSAS